MGFSSGDVGRHHEMEVPLSRGRGYLPTRYGVSKVPVQQHCVGVLRRHYLELLINIGEMQVSFG